MVPIRGCSFGSTTSVRDVPSASGWPGHSAAAAIWLLAQVSASRHRAVRDRFQTPRATLAITGCLPTLFYNSLRYLSREVVRFATTSPDTNHYRRHNERPLNGLY